MPGCHANAGQEAPEQLSPDLPLLWHQRKNCTLPRTPSPPLCFCNVVLCARQLGERPAKFPAKGPGILQRVWHPAEGPGIPARWMTPTRDSQ